MQQKCGFIENEPSSNCHIVALMHIINPINRTVYLSYTNILVKLTGYCDAAEVHFGASYRNSGLIDEYFSQHIRVRYDSIHQQMIVDNDTTLPISQQDTKCSRITIRQCHGVRIYRSTKHMV